MCVGPAIFLHTWFLHRVNQEEMLLSVREKRTSLEEIAVANRIMNTVRERERERESQPHNNLQPYICSFTSSELKVVSAARQKLGLLWSLGLPSSLGLPCGLVVWLLGFWDTSVILTGLHYVEPVARSRRFHTC